MFDYSGTKNSYYYDPARDPAPNFPVAEQCPQKPSPLDTQHPHRFLDETPKH